MALVIVRRSPAADIVHPRHDLAPVQVRVISVHARVDDADLYALACVARSPGLVGADLGHRLIEQNVDLPVLLDIFNARLLSKLLCRLVR
jgi:hypothetical protein